MTAILLAALAGAALALAAVTAGALYLGRNLDRDARAMAWASQTAWTHEGMALAARALRSIPKRNKHGLDPRVLSLVADGIEDAARAYQRDRVAAASDAELLALAKLRDVDLAAITPKLPTAPTPETP